MSAHLISYEEILSRLADKLGITIDALKQLSSQYIKEIDFSDTGRFVLPDVMQLKKAQRVEPYELAIKNLQQAQCQSPKFVDALFVPENPESGEKGQLFLVNEEAKQVILQDHKCCEEALSGSSKKDVIQKLNDLGVMDQFNGAVHESVLRHKSADLASQYRKALDIRLCLRSEYLNRSEVLPEDDNDIDLDVSTPYRRIEASYQDRLKDIAENVIERSGERIIIIKGSVGAIIRTEKEQRQLAKGMRRRAISELQKKLIKVLTKTIRKLEQQAMEHAQTMSSSKRGGTFTFDTKRRFYTSNEDLELEKLIEIIAEQRRYMGWWEVEEHELDEHTDLPSPTTAYQSYKCWRIGHKALSEMKAGPFETVDDFLADYSKQKRIRKQDIIFPYPKFFDAVFQLNQRGYYLKEQYLGVIELHKGYTGVEAFINYVTEHNPSIADIEAQLKNMLLNLHPWSDTKQGRRPRLSEQFEYLGYYSARVLSLFLTKMIAVRITEFAERFGDNPDYGHYVRTLISYKERAVIRCDKLHTLARRKKLRDGMDYMKTVPKKRRLKRLLWSESAQHYEPRNLNDRLLSQVNIGQRTVVECGFSSQPGKVLYILSDNPVISSDPVKNKLCSRPFKPSSPMIDEQSQKSFLDGIKDGLGANSETSLGQFFEMKQVGSWAELPAQLLSWKKEDLFGQGSLETTSSAQFARYIFSKESGKLDQKVISRNSVGIKSELHIGASLVSGQASWKARLPASPEVLLLPYRKKGSKATEFANIGKTQYIVEGILYGAVAASVKIGTELHIGNVSSQEEEADSRGNFGVVGRTPQRTDYPVYQTSGQPLSKGAAAGMSVEGKAFAGVEAGGKLSFDFMWEPYLGRTAFDQDNYGEACSLFKLAAGVKVTAGVGVEGVLQCTYQKGRLVFIQAYSLTKGLGFGGKVATELNPQQAGKFCEAVLDITNREGFQRFLFFDEGGDRDAFAVFNTVLTVAACYALTIGQVLALPFNIIDNMEKLAADKVNGFFVANFLNDKKYFDVNEKWIRKMPPETLAKLLTALVHYTSIPTFDWLGMTSIEKERRRAAERNQSRRKAINRVLGWLYHKYPAQQARQRFENAVQRMGLEQPTELDKTVQWKRYAENVMALDAFFKRAFKEPYQYPPQDPKAKKEDYMETLRDDYKDFKKHMISLTRNMKVMKRREMNAGRSWPDEYIAAQINEDTPELHEKLKKRGYQLVSWL